MQLTSSFVWAPLKDINDRVHLINPWAITRFLYCEKDGVWEVYILEQVKIFCRREEIDTFIEKYQEFFKRGVNGEKNC